MNFGRVSEQSSREFAPGPPKKQAESSIRSLSKKEASGLKKLITKEFSEGLIKGAEVNSRSELREEITKRVGSRKRAAVDRSQEQTVWLPVGCE